MSKLEAIVAALCLSCLLGCETYDGYRTFGTTRTLVHSDTPGMVKVVSYPFTFLGEILASPVTAYMDAGNHPPQSASYHVYWSYRSMRTVMRSDMHDWFKFWGQLLPFVVDSVWLPVSGSVDIGHVLMTDGA